jgi:KGK domain
MTLKFKSFSENSVLQMTTEENVPFVTQKMFDQLEFFDRLRKTRNNGIYKWISNSFDCNILVPNQDWQKGTITLKLLFYPGGIELMGNDTIIYLSVKQNNSITKDLSFFTPDKFENVMKTTQGEEAYKLISNEAYELINNKVECRILVPGEEWQNGEIGLFLVFCPEQENINTSDVQQESLNSSLDGIRKIIAEISPLDEIRQLSNELTSMASSIEQN